MWKVDPMSGQSFRDSTLGDHPVLFEQEPDLRPLQAMLREHFGTAWFSIEQAVQFTLAAPFRDNGHLKPRLKVAETEGALKVDEVHKLLVAHGLTGATFPNTYTEKAGGRRKK